MKKAKKTRIVNFSAVLRTRFVDSSLLSGRCLCDCQYDHFFLEDASMMVNPSGCLGKCTGLVLGNCSDQFPSIMQFGPSEQDVVVMDRHGTVNTSKDLPVDTGLLLTHEATVGQTKWWQNNSIPD